MHEPEFLLICSLWRYAYNLKKPAFRSETEELWLSPDCDCPTTKNGRRLGLEENVIRHCTGAWRLEIPADAEISKKKKKEMNHYDRAPKGKPECLQMRIRNVYYLKQELEEYAETGY